MWVCLATGCGGDAPPASDSTSTTTSDESSSTTAEPVVCDPMPNGGAGIAFAGEPEAGVWCIDQVCAGGCDCFEVPKCNVNGDDAHDVLCDGAEDCGMGEVCCAVNDGVGVNRTFTTCAMGACAEGASVVCNSDEECGDGFCVRAYSNDASLDMGVCQASVPSLCTGMKATDCGGASLAGADFTDADLRGSSFCSADLSGARLRRAFLDDALLMDANLMGADAGFASFRNANLSGVDFSGATIHEADFTGANLANVIATGALGGDVICPDGAMLMVPGDPLCAAHQLPP